MKKNGSRDHNNSLCIFHNPGQSALTLGLWFALKVSNNHNPNIGNKLNDSYLFETGKEIHCQAALAPMS